MLPSSKHVQVFSTAIVLIASLNVAPPCLRADEPLRWKFEVGEKLNYNMVQEMVMSSANGPGSTTMKQEMNMTWDVQGVDKATGEAVIKQKFDRVKMKMTMTTPPGSFEYDSKSETAPTGLGAMIAPMYKAMTNGEFEITMTARGEVKDVKIPEEVLTALKSSPGAAQMGDIASPEGFKKMISQGALVLPESVPKKGDTWTTKVDMKNPAVGKQTVETTYTYDGTKEEDGTTYAVIRPQLKMEFEKPAAAADQAPPLSMKIAEQSSEGEVLFNIGKGRLFSTTLQQKVTIEASAKGQTMRQKIDQKIDVKVTPAGDKSEVAEEKKSDEVEKKPEVSSEKSANKAEEKATSDN